MLPDIAATAIMTHLGMDWNGNLTNEEAHGLCGCKLRD